MNEIIKSLYDRKSVRVYEDRPIPEKMKQIILEAAAQAPSAGCQQLYTILDITDQKLKDELVKTCDNQPFIATAPMVLVFCADCKKWYDAYLRFRSLQNKVMESQAIRYLSTFRRKMGST